MKPKAEFSEEVFRRTRWVTEHAATDIIIETNVAF
jgi:hypothetical protein